MVRERWTGTDASEGPGRDRSARCRSTGALPDRWDIANGFTFREVFVCQLLSLLVRIGAITCAVPSRLSTAPVRDELLAA